ASSLSTQNVAFISSESSNSTNDVSTTYVGSTTPGNNSQKETPSSCSLLANQSSCPQLDHEDIEQLDEFDLEEMDLKWQVAMIFMRLKKFHKKSGRKILFDAKESVGFDKTKVECYNCHKTGHFARECRFKGNQDNKRRDTWNSRNKANDNSKRLGKKEESNALMTLNEGCVDWTSQKMSKTTMLSWLSVTQDQTLSDASVDIQSYTLALKKVEAQLVVHQNQLWYEEKIRFMKIDLDDKTDVLTYHKKLLAEALEEKEDLKKLWRSYCPPSKTAKQLEEIRLIHGMTPAQALTAIQTMANHSQKWHDGSSSRNTESGSNFEGIATIVSKLDNLGRDMKKLKENMHAIQVGCQNCRGAHLDKDYPLNEEVKIIEEAKYGEFRSPSPFSNGAKYRVGPPRYNTHIDNHLPFREKRPSLEEFMNKHLEESTRRRTKMEERVKKL
ncbi:ribonuclease H-like domain-containing protein, partial [Tanacetum coccineum]